jgi:hypothetical protein
MLMVAVPASAQLLDNVPLIIDPADVDAWTATISLPIPRSAAEAFGDNLPHVSAGIIGHSKAVGRVVAWHERDTIPSRVLYSIASDKPIGAEADMRVGVSSSSLGGVPDSPWTVKAETFKRIDYTGYEVILRGGSHEKSFSRFQDIVLNYNGKDGAKSVALRFGVRRDDTHHWWQWLAQDTLVDEHGLKVVRVGGLLYNEDSFHFVDIYFELFGNGVARVYAHFVNSRLIGDGWEFFGIPVIGITSDGAASVDTPIDGTKTTFDLGDTKLNIAESTEMAGPEHPGRMYTHDGVTIYQPWQDQRVTDKVQTFDKPFVVNIGDEEIPKGMARTVRFTLSLSDAPAKVARMLAPNWLYAMNGDLWHGDMLPVTWRLADKTHSIAAPIAKPDARYHGTYEAGYSDRASEGNGGGTMMFSAYASGDINHRDRSLSYGYAWADMMIDHVDWSVRQPYTGYYWKTHPYTKFNDLVWAYLETGDPYLLETAEHVGDAYWALIRSNWPARSMGRGAWPATGLLMLHQATGEEVYLKRALDIVDRSRKTYINADELPGHQIGVGPNGIGNKNDPGDQGFAELVLARTAIEAALLRGGEEADRVLKHAAYVADTVIESLNVKGENDPGGWLYYETDMLLITLLPLAAHGDRPDLAEELEARLARVPDYLERGESGRPYQAAVGRAYYDAETLHATWRDGALHINPRLLPPAADGKTATVSTPAGPVQLKLRVPESGTPTAERTGGADVKVRVIRMR